MDETPGQAAGAPLVEASILNRLQSEGFASVTDLASFCRNWLSLNCSTVRACNAGAVFALQGKQLVLAAAWPDSSKPAFKNALPRLSAAARASQIEKGGVLLDAKLLAALGSSPQGTHYVSVPVEIEGGVWGYAAVEIVSNDPAAVRAVLERLQWATGWFGWFRSRELQQQTGKKRWRLETAMDLLAAVVGHRQFKEAAIALVNQLAPRFSSDRVSLGVMKSDQIELVAVSGATIVDNKMNIMEALEAAMEEAVDQKASVQYPSAEDVTAAERKVVRHHQLLGQEGGASRATLTVLLRSGGEVLGALTLERDLARPFKEDEIEVLEAAGELLGPLVELQRRESRFIGAKVAESALGVASKVLGPGHTGYKLATILGLGLILFFSFAHWDYRISADCVVEAEVQLASSAPFDGFLREALVRAGDPVAQDQLMAVLDDRELWQQLLETRSRERQLQSLYQRALGQKDAAQQRILSAQRSQVEAEIALLEERIEQTRIRSPFDGVVVSGDWSQALGSPVGRGDVLFEVAPLNEFRLVLRVDERDIDELEVGQAGEFRLLSRPQETYLFRVSLITPVSSVEEGRNVFRVEAAFEEFLPWLRPGLEGVGKVEVGRRLLVWIWTHRLLDFIRLYLWV